LDRYWYRIRDERGSDADEVQKAKTKEKNGLIGTAKVRMKKRTID
jgi:hypothetical protein